MSKSKQDKSGGLAPELDQARSKLDGVLQNLMEKTEESHSSSSQSDDDYKPSDIIMKEPSPISSPSKRSQKSQRKRRRKDEAAIQSSNTYITKIYGCSVDLAQFDENSPLYAMCRSWIQNKPVQQSEKLFPTDDEDDKKAPEEGGDKEPTEGIYSLPAPTPLPRDKESNIKDLRIPETVQQPSEKFFMAADDSEVVPVNVLLANHQARWKSIRQKWKEAAMANEERYKESTSMLLKAMSQDEGGSWEGVQA
ncbi:protein lin-37 homolog isoform X2 [Ornithodoros turicata]|uniref:protein lin-37 homolog isoform X2 n=1 Tax=Ornithodoros turicata TaxID=34597 RepID=UPI0031390BD8